jgi:hypothetical protein
MPKLVITKDVIDDFISKTGLNIISTSGTGHKLLITFIAECGHEETVTYRSFKRRGINGLCKTCFKESMAEKYKFDIEDVRKIFSDNNCELLATKYINNSTNLKYKCECGNTACIKLYKLQRGDRCGCKQFLTGKDANRYNPELSDYDRENGRSIEGYKEWRKQVYERDDHTCQCCGKRGVPINAHHLESYATNKEIRTSVDNGITLCQNSCHRAFHMIYGIKDNTREQLMEFIECNKEYHIDNLNKAV